MKHAAALAALLERIWSEESRGWKDRHRVLRAAERAAESLSSDDWEALHASKGHVYSDIDSLRALAAAGCQSCTGLAARYDAFAREAARIEHLHHS
jgi:hypothetical protein